MASIERYVLAKRDGPGRVRRVVRYRIRYRGPDGRAHSETFPRRDDAERRRSEIEASLVSATWLDSRRGEITLADWARDWLPTQHDHLGAAGDDDGAPSAAAIRVDAAAAGHQRRGTGMST